MADTVPLVIYRGEKRIVIGTAIVDENGGVRGMVNDLQIIKDLQPYTGEFSVGPCSFGLVLADEKNDNWRVKVQTQLALTRIRQEKRGSDGG